MGLRSNSTTSNQKHERNRLLFDQILFTFPLDFIKDRHSGVPRANPDIDNENESPERTRKSDAIRVSILAEQVIIIMIKKKKGWNCFAPGKNVIHSIRSEHTIYWQRKRKGEVTEMLLEICVGFVVFL